MIDWGIPSLSPDTLCQHVPDRFFLWRTKKLSEARGCTLCFYCWDAKLEQLWRRPTHYSHLFLRHGVAALIEPDYSLWADDPLVVQAYNTYRTRFLGRYWQEAGLQVIPSLNWSDARSFSFCFAGIPHNAPVVATVCRTPGGDDCDRRAFLRGLAEAVKQVRPRNVLVYGGGEHRWWLSDHLPEGPRYVLLESWTHQRDKQRAAAKRQERNNNQLFLELGGAPWVGEEAAADAA
jgi:hypothetical protein